MNLIEKAVSVAEGQSALARRYQAHGFHTVKQGTVLKWLNAGRIPAEWAAATELATDGAVKAVDVFMASQRKPGMRRGSRRRSRSKRAA